MVDESPEARRKRRFALPPVAFVGGILAFAAILAVVILIVYFVAGGERVD